MHRRYTVVLVSPPGYAHAPALLDVARLLVHSFESLGLPCRLVVNTLDRDAINIVLGWHLIPDPVVLAPYRAIIYQLEQLTDREAWFNERREAVLREADEIWDFAPDNIDFLRGRGIRARLLPLGYHEALVTIPFDAPPEIDVLFYGLVNERRQAIIDALSPHCRVQALFGVYGERRDDQVARSRIVLNVHRHERRMMEQVRLSYLLNNGRFVVSEESADNPYGETLATAPYDGLVDACVRYLDRPGECDRLAAVGHDFFATRSMPEYLQVVLAPQSETVVS